MVEDHLLFVLKSQTCSRFGHVCMTLGSWKGLDACMHGSQVVPAVMQPSIGIQGNLGLVGQLLEIGWLGAARGASRAHFSPLTPLC